MPNKNMDPTSEGATADLTSSREACQANRDLNQEKEATDTTLAKQVAKAVGRWQRPMCSTKPG